MFYLRVRGAAVAAVLAASVLAAPAASGYAHTNGLRFITTGLTCSGGVCNLAGGSVGQNYGQDLAITGGSCGRPCSSLPVFTIASGALPAGLTMPTTYGCCGEVIAVSPAGAPRITFPATCCPAGKVGASYLQNFFLTGGIGPFSAAISRGSLPPGLVLSAAPPIAITGTPTTAGTFTFTVRVTDSTGSTATKMGSITIG